jgi:hypothetical protein
LTTNQKVAGSSLAERALKCPANGGVSLCGNILLQGILRGARIQYMVHL